MFSDKVGSHEINNHAVEETRIGCDGYVAAGDDACQRNFTKKSTNSTTIKLKSQSEEKTIRSLVRPSLRSIIPVD